jgi:homoserine O-acetyltransferase
MGGMQALAWPTLFPHRVRSVVAIATTDRHSPRQIALNEVARQAVLADPAWNGGRYLPGSGPSHGLAVARMLGHVTYLSDESMDRKFGRRLRDGRRRFEIGPQFEVEHYLRHQGDRFVERFDANALLYITHAIDHFDMSEGFADLERAAAATRARFLLLAFSSDWLYPPSDLARIAARLEASGKSVMYRCIEDDRGHDAFLLNDDEQARLIGRFLGGAGALRAI